MSGLQPARTENTTDPKSRIVMPGGVNRVALGSGVLSLPPVSFALWLLAAHPTARSTG
ncbi:hypothetical protein L228DRAFT_251264 [Xylona heveae TC161]|uniref:Uncharacterized protein n=1 Tax=Xylona heveae (strain CBS 132557 / TC161) TaxID=1328760 RepID=A0A164ZJA1_XYLHT|nr:hypothetical protein L228DRAFT_251264 [Xylona heveae TC161]KZF19167.1 hypothetical protein L228DRAFT_251264 [Xylona heveae TC161]